jgi:hypothetical protein
MNGALKLLHHRFGHLNMKGVHILQNIVGGMNVGKFSRFTSLLFCKAHIESKQHKATILNEK